MVPGEKMTPGDAGNEVFHKTPNGKVRYFCGRLVGEETKEVGEMSIVKLVALTPPHTNKKHNPLKNSRLGRLVVLWIFC